MPNWVDNNVVIMGPREDLYHLLEVANSLAADENTSTLFSLEKLRPMPVELVGTNAPADNPNWYNWCMMNWGTKWDIEVTSIDKTQDNSVSFGFLSAWSPPLEAFQYASKQFPSLEISIRYAEPGMGFAGSAYYAGGKLKHSEEYEMTTEMVDYYINTGQILRNNL